MNMFILMEYFLMLTFVLSVNQSIFSKNSAVNLKQFPDSKYKAV